MTDAELIVKAIRQMVERDPWLGVTGRRAMEALADEIEKVLKEQPNDRHSSVAPRE